MSIRLKDLDISYVKERMFRPYRRGTLAIRLINLSIQSENLAKFRPYEVYEYKQSIYYIRFL